MMSIKKPHRKKNMYETQLDYIKILIDAEEYSDAIEKLDYIKTQLEKYEKRKIDTEVPN